MEKKLKITQIRSGIGKLAAQKRTIKALGLKKMHASVIHTDSPVVRGMIETVHHLIKVEEIKVDEAKDEIMKAEKSNGPKKLQKSKGKATTNEIE
jgi:large subunit ribosomal protein L30